MNVRSMSGRPGRFAAGSDHGRRRFHLPPVRACLSVRLPPGGQARPVQDVPGRLPDPRVRARPRRPARSRDGHDIEGARSRSRRLPGRRDPPMTGRSSSTARPAGTAIVSTRSWPANRDAAPPAAASSRSPLNPAPRPEAGRRRRSGARPRPIARPDGRDGPGSGPGPTRPDTARSHPPAARGPVGRPPVPPLPAAGDSGWWELDSSESIPAATAPGHRRTLADGGGHGVFRPRNGPRSKTTTFRW